MELLVISAVMSVLALALFGTFRTQTHTASRESARNVTQATLRIWLNRMVTDIQRAGFNPDDTGTAPLFGFVAASATEVRFTINDPPYASYDASSPQENVGYRVSAADGAGFGTFQRWLGGSQWRTLLPHVRMSLRYFDNQGVELNPAAPPLSAIRHVSITLTGVAETGGFPGTSPPEVSEAASALVRNSLAG